jgi:SAM-dependent methyltransferase
MTGQSILEAGSGAGRFTEILLATGATIFSFDLSSAVDANYANNGRSPRLHLFQGSIYEVPLQRAAFDKVLCLGVLQHTPDPAKSFRELVSFVKPGGEIAIDVYARNLRSMIGWKYLLRPITKRLSKKLLFRGVQACVTLFLKPAIVARRIGGAFGARLFPILQYSHWGLPLELNRDWAVLDTFDMYSPAHDHPQTLKQVRRWFEEAGLQIEHIGYGPNGVVARGRVPFPGGVGNREGAPECEMLDR